MEKTVKFHPAQEVPSAELNDLQAFARTSFDALINNLLVRNVYYKGMAVTKNSATEVAISAGRLWSNGASYVRETGTTLAMTAYLPAGANKKIVSLVASGVQTDEEAAPRKFLVDPTLRTVRARTVETRTERNVIVSLVEGVAGLAPTAPTIDLGYAHLCDIVLSSSGIVGDPEMKTTHLAPNLEDLVGLYATLRGDLDLQLGMIRTLRTDLSALFAKIAGLATKQDIAELWKAINDLKKGSGGVQNPPTNTTSDFDDFDDSSKSDTAHVNFACVVGQGRVGMPRGGNTSQIAALLNPIDSRVKQFSNGLVLPDYDEQERYYNNSKDAEIALASYPVVSRNRTQLHQAISLKLRKTDDAAFRKVIRQGKVNVSLVDPATGDVLTVAINQYKWRYGASHVWGRWIVIEDWEPYWPVGSSATSVNGSMIGQTFLNAQGGWLTHVVPFVSSLGPSGDVRLIVCECDSKGEPDLDMQLADVSMVYSEFADRVANGSNPGRGWARFDLIPVHLAAGKRYATVFITQGAHKLWASNNNAVANGQLVYAANASNWTPIGGDLSMQLKYAEFKKTVLNVELESIALVGGIYAFDAVFTDIRPGACDLDVQGQIGGVWRNLDGTDPTALSATPTLIPLRLVWQNTKDDAVGVVLNKSRLIASRASLSAVHVSTVITVPAAGTVTSVKVVQELQDFDDTPHDHVVRVLHGAGYTTVKNPATTATKTLANGNIERTYTFDFTGTPISTFKIRTEMTITDPTNEFAVLDRLATAA